MFHIIYADVVMMKREKVKIVNLTRVQESMSIIMQNVNTGIREKHAQIDLLRGTGSMRDQERISSKKISENEEILKIPGTPGIRKKTEVIKKTGKVKIHVWINCVAIFG